jgi:predicted Na+-dependent transporter
VLFAVAVKVAIVFVESAMGTKATPAGREYYKIRFGAGYYSVGFWSTISSIVGIVVNWFFVGMAVRACNGELRAVELSIVCLGAAQVRLSM